MLTIKELGKTYGTHQALQDISFSVGEGEIIALLGANGSGKTTTINSICGLIEFEQGDIQFDGNSIRGHKSYLRHIGAVLGGCRNINWRLTPAQNAEYFARLRGASPKQFRPEIQLLQEKLGLDKYAKKEVLKLSTGNKQKSALLSALSYQPRLLLLDEPTLGLDLETVSALQQIIKEQCERRQQSFLITSHDMSFIDAICSRVIVLEEGKMIFAGEISDLKRQLYKFQMQVRLDEDARAKLNGHLNNLWHGKHQIEEGDDHITINYDQVDQSFATVKWMEEQGIKPVSLNIGELSIENAYRALLGQQKSSDVEADK